MINKSAEFSPWIMHPKKMHIWLKDGAIYMPLDAKDFFPRSGTLKNIQHGIIIINDYFLYIGYVSITYVCDALFTDFYSILYLRILMKYLEMVLDKSHFT